MAELADYISRQRMVAAKEYLPVEARAELSDQRPNELIGLRSGHGSDLKIEDAFVFPKWFVQQNSWLDNPCRSDNVAYNYSLSLRLVGSLQEPALRRALRELTRRHGVLRSVFRMQDGEMTQAVLPSVDLKIDVKDSRGLSEGEREAYWQQIAREDANRPFDPTLEPLFRVTLIRFADDNHVLQLTTHHLIHDDWSTSVLLRELSELYLAFATNKAPALAPLTFQYGDFVRWQQQQLTGERLSSRLSYWRNQFSDIGRFEHLAPDFPKSTVPAWGGARQSAGLPDTVAGEISELARRERVSLFMILLTGFKCLLHQYSGDEEIGIGTCAANRTVTEAENLIGHFGNDMLLRTSFSSSPTFREILMRVRQTALTAYSNQDVPFGMVLDGVPASNGRGPFQGMFILQNAPRQDQEIPGLRMTWLSVDPGTAKHDLIVWLKTEPKLEVTLEYRTDVFRAATMQRLLSDYQMVLESMVADPGSQVTSTLLSRTGDVTALSRNTEVSERATVSRNGATPSVDLEPRLVALWEAAFKHRPIKADHDFFELGGDSLLAARLFAQMEKAFGMELPVSLLLEAPTISQLAGHIASRNRHLMGSSLVTIQPNGTRPPFFYIHDHMGEVLYCRNLSRALGADQPIYGLRSQGLGGEMPHRSVEEMAAHYLKEIRKVQPNGPYFLSGYCLGGMVAFEMAKLLHAEGDDVNLLVLFNAPSPGGLEGWPLNRVYLTRRVAHELRKLKKMPLREKVTSFVKKATAFASLVLGLCKARLLRALRSLSIDGVEKKARRLLSVADINVSAAKAYRPGGYPGRVTLFLTQEVASLYATDPTEGWSKLAQGGIEIHQVAGDNNSMFDLRFVDELAKKLRRCIEEASEPLQKWDARSKSNFLKTTPVPFTATAPR